MDSNSELSPIEKYIGLRRLHEHWLSFLILGIVLVLLGSLAIIGANTVTFATIIFFSILLTIGGILQIAYAFWGRKGQSFAQTILSGIFYTIIGILMLSHPTVSALAVTLLLAAFFTVSGLFKIIISLTAPMMQWGWILLSGLVSLVLGILIWAEWPTSGLWVIGLFIGIDLIVVGWCWIMFSLASRNMTRL